jgi:hypothetical protein
VVNHRTDIGTRGNGLLLNLVDGNEVLKPLLIIIIVVVSIITIDEEGREKSSRHSNQPFDILLSPSDNIFIYIINCLTITVLQYLN